MLVVDDEWILNAKSWLDQWWLWLSSTTGSWSEIIESDFSNSKCSPSHPVSTSRWSSPWATPSPTPPIGPARFWMPIIRGPGRACAWLRTWKWPHWTWNLRFQFRGFGVSPTTFPSSLASSICASACATLNIGLAEKRGKVVNSWWVGNCVCGWERMVFGTLRMRSQKGGGPKGTSRNLDFVGNLPRSSKIFTEFVVGFLWIPFRHRENPHKRPTLYSAVPRWNPSRKTNGGDLCQAIKIQLSHARNNQHSWYVCFFYHPSIGVMKSSPWKSESHFSQTNQEHCMRWNLLFFHCCVGPVKKFHFP